MDRFLEKGEIAQAKGKLRKAKEHFLSAVRVDGASGVAHNNLGFVHYQLGDYYAAAWSFQHAIERMPDNPEPIYNLALTWEATERLSAARGLYQQACAFSPDNPVYLANLLRVRMKLGEPVASFLPELQTLLQIETRPEWREWAKHLRHYEVLVESLSDSRDMESSTQYAPVLEIPLPGPPRVAPMP